MRRALGCAALVRSWPAAGCGGTLDAGRDVPHSPLLPVDERNPVILINDGWTGNWSGEYAVSAGQPGGPPLAGIIVNADQVLADPQRQRRRLDQPGHGARDRAASPGSPTSPLAWRRRCRSPATVRSIRPRPIAPAGAQLIVDLSRQLSLPLRPVVACSPTRH